MAHGPEDVGVAPSTVIAVDQSTHIRMVSLSIANAAGIRALSVMDEMMT
jgi:hypothetical protein